MPLLVLQTNTFRQSTLQDVNIPNVDREQDFSLLGGILSSDLNYVWHAKGPTLEVRCAQRGVKVGSWTFGSILKDSTTEIACVDEIRKPGGRISLLAVAVNCADDGFVCIFDIFTSKIIRAIQIREKISYLHIIDSGCDDACLPGVLKYFQGTVAVGTHGGNVYLLDLCRQACEDSLQTAPSTIVRDELHPCEMVILQREHLHKISKYVDKCVRNSDHLAVHLNAVSDSLTEHFTLKGPKGDDRIHVNRDEIEVSSLYFSTQLTSLLIGYNFGAFQIWELQSCQLMYTSPVCDEHIPVTHFAVQEPSDDPKAYCYVWVAYSNTRPFETGLPFAVMYSLYYEDRVLIPNYGYVYKDFQHCTIRFQIELIASEHEKYGSKAQGGFCMGIESVKKNPSGKNSLELCLITWSIWFSETETQTLIMLFDLNQWYKEQMPSVPNWDNYSNYMIRQNLNDHLGASLRKNELLLDVKIDGRSISQFMGIQRLEEHFCPTSLSFDIWCLSENSITKLHNQGKQAALLSSLVNFGPLCLLKPKDISQEIATVGLIPLFCDVCNIGEASLDTQREVILNVALEQNLTGWLCKCASEWANGSFSSSGCTLNFLLSWAFQRAYTLKTSCDQFCRPLFDYSESRIDDNTNRLLYNCCRQIGGLLVLYEYATRTLMQYIPNFEHVSEQCRCLQNVTNYYEVLLWLVNAGLLPECHLSAYPRLDENGKIRAPYAVDQLAAYYDERRANLQQLCGDLFINSDSLLFIDNLIAYKCGSEKLQKQWQEDGGSGMYPPPSLQSVIRTYLIENANTADKHSLVSYLFLDIAMVLDKNKYGEVVKQLLKFSSVFNVSLSVIKIIQGFWHLDHGDFETALENIFDPGVLKEDLEHWHDIIALRSFITQNQFKYALHYLQVRKPTITEEKDVVVALSVLVANNMLDKAFHFIKQSPDNHKYLVHFFNECNKNGKLSAMLYKYLDKEEEKAFIKYLRSNGNPKSEDLQVFYYLLRSRFPEALDTYEQVKRKRPEHQGLLGQSNASKTDHILKIYKDFLPDINKKFVDVVRKERVNLFNKISEQKPVPLSVYIHDTKEKVRYKSSVIFDALTTAKQTFNDSVHVPRNGITEETPFLRTPKATTDTARQITPLITPKFIELDDKGEYLGPSPPKRLKLSPRLTKTSPVKLNESIHSKMSTPVVKRKRSGESINTSSSNIINVCTPQSILKVRNLIRYRDQDVSTDHIDTSHLSSKPRFDVSSRQPINRASHVKFDDLRYSSSLSEVSNETSLNNTRTDKDNSETSNNKCVESKNSSEEVFYSPDVSLTEKETISISKDKSEICENKRVALGEHLKDTSERTSENVEEISLVEETTISASPKTVTTPRARRSYKRSLDESPRLRSSPRLSKVNKDDSHESIISNISAVEEPLEKSEVVNPSPRPQKMHGRKSLSRMVLENNAFAVLAQNVSKELMYSKTESIKTVEVSNNSSNTTMEEMKVEISDSINVDPESPLKNYNHSISSSSKIIFETTSTTDISNTYNEQLSDYSDLEYLEEDEAKSKEIDDEPITNNEQIKSLLAESSTLFDDKNMSSAENTEKVDNHEEDKDGFQPDDKKESSETVGEVNVYEDLSSGAEDIDEVFSGENRSGARNEEHMEAGDKVNYREDVSMDLSITERAFILESCDDDEVIEIGSSDDEKKSVSSGSWQHSEATTRSNSSRLSSSSENRNSSDEEYELHLEESLLDDIPEDPLEEDAQEVQEEAQDELLEEAEEEQEDILEEAQEDHLEEEPQGDPLGEDAQEEKENSESELSIIDNICMQPEIVQVESNVQEDVNCEVATVNEFVVVEDDLKINNAIDGHNEDVPMLQLNALNQSVEAVPDLQIGESVAKEVAVESTALPEEGVLENVQNNERFKEPGSIEHTEAAQVVANEEKADVEKTKAGTSDTVEIQNVQNKEHFKEPGSIEPTEAAQVVANEEKADVEKTKAVTSVEIEITKGKNESDMQTSQTISNEISECASTSADSIILKTLAPKRTYAKSSVRKIEEEATQSDTVNSSGEEQDHDVQTPVFKQDVKRTYLPLMKVKTPRRTYSRRLTSKSLLDQTEGQIQDEIKASESTTTEKQTENSESSQANKIIDGQVVEENRVDSQKSEHIDQRQAEVESKVDKPVCGQVVEENQVESKVDKPTRKTSSRERTEPESDKKNDESIISKIESSVILDKLDVSQSISTKTSMSSSESASQEQPPLRRVTRSSTFHSHDDSQHLESTPSSTPTKTRRRSVAKEDPVTEVETKKSPIKRTHGTILENTNINLDETKNKFRKRALSSDTPSILREEKKPLRRGRAASVCDLPIIEERPTNRKKASSAVGRRVTRKNSKLQESEQDAVDDSEKTVWQIDPIDPIKLLDKSPFKGKPDPEEEVVLKELSPSPSSSTRRVTRKRSSSVASDISLPPSASVTNSPKREGSESRAGSPVLTGIRTRLRKTSTDTVASEVSSTSSKTRKKQGTHDDNSGSSLPARRVTRSRSNSISSVTSVKSDINETAKKGSRRKGKSVAELPEISEVGEPAENVETKASTRTRKKRQ